MYMLRMSHNLHAIFSAKKPANYYSYPSKKNTHSSLVDYLAQLINWKNSNTPPGSCEREAWINEEDGKLFLLLLVLYNYTLYITFLGCASFKSFSRWLEQCFLKVGQNNFWKKIPLRCLESCFFILCKF